MLWGLALSQREEILSEEEDAKNRPLSRRAAQRVAAHGIVNGPLPVLTVEVNLSDGRVLQTRSLPLLPRWRTDMRRLVRDKGREPTS